MFVYFTIYCSWQYDINNRTEKKTTVKVRLWLGGSHFLSQHLIRTGLVFLVSQAPPFSPVSTAGHCGTLVGGLQMQRSHAIFRLSKQPTERKLLHTRTLNETVKHVIKSPTSTFNCSQSPCGQTAKPLSLKHNQIMKQIFWTSSTWAKFNSTCSQLLVPSLQMLREQWVSEIEIKSETHHKNALFLYSTSEIK